jgi:hypothetical protein
MPWAATRSRGGSRRRPSGGTHMGAPVEAEASRRAAPRRRSPPRCRTGLEVTVAELAGVLAEDLMGRATDVAQWAQRLLDEGAPPERLVGAIQWSQFWTRHGGDEISWNTTPCDLRLCAATRASPPNRRRRPKTPTSPASGRCKRRSRPPRRSRRSGIWSNPLRRSRRTVAHQPTPSVARVHKLSLRSVRMTSVGPPPAGSSCPSIGLRDRVEAVGGALGVHSRVGQGIRLVVELPLDPSRGS